MALIRCPRCGKEIDDCCKLCPYCRFVPIDGWDIPPDQSKMKPNKVKTAKQSKKVQRKLFLLIAICVSALLAWYFFFPKTVEQKNGVKHQIGRFNDSCDCNECSGSKYVHQCERETTHKIKYILFDTTYCDECWNHDGKQMFEHLCNFSAKDDNSVSKTIPKSRTSSTAKSFTNKYGTSTTVCAHSGCTDYIASSGDTNCCQTHSNKCGECGKYIDEDALFCVECILKASSSASTNSSSSSSQTSSPMCEKCSKKGTHSIEGFNGTPEYYCDDHWEKLMGFASVITGG